MQPADGRLGVLIVGLGAVASTLIAGVELVKRGLAEPIGSLALMDTIRLGKRTDDRNPLIRDFVPIAALEDIVFGAWDPFPDDAYVAAQRAGVLDAGKHVEQISEALRDVRPMPAAFERTYVKNIDADNIKGAIGKRAMLEAIREDINRFKDEKQVDRVVMLWAASTEIFIEPGPAHTDLEAFEAAIDADDPTIAPSMLYAYAAILEGVPFGNGAPNLTVDIAGAARPRHRARRRHLRQGLQDRPDADQDGARADAEGPHARPVRAGTRRTSWATATARCSTIRTTSRPRRSRSSACSSTSSSPRRSPTLYGDIFHKVRINYYPPRGDNKEGWDNIDIFGWLGYPMQIKVDFLCRDSILAAPLALDLVLFTDLAQRAGLGGIQEWLSFYYKSPMAAPGLLAEDDLFIQLTKLKNTLRWIMGEDQITHLGREYYA